MTKIIPGFPAYTVSTSGVVTNTTTNLIKKSWVGKNGYAVVDLYHEGTSKKYYMHRLLADMFIPNPENKRTVNHIDGVKTNNSLDNLEWATDSENMQHAYCNNLNYCSTKLISDEAIKEILEKFFLGESLTKIVEEYEFSLPTFSTYVEQYTKDNGTHDKFIEEKTRQKNLRAKKAGLGKRKLITLVMTSLPTGEALHTFSSVTEAKNFLKVKSCGPISNVLAGRQKTAYGYGWKTI